MEEIMQPDLLSDESQQPESLSPQDMAQPESLSALPATPRAAGMTEPELSPMQKMHPKYSWAAIGLVVLVILLLAVFGLAGYWAYALSSELVTARQQLATLQGAHETLQADYASLTGSHQNVVAELTQTRASLEAANTDLTAAQSDLKKLQDDDRDASTRIKKAGRLLDILYAWVTVDSAIDIFAIDTMIKESKDAELMARWEELTTSQSEDALSVFVEFLIDDIRNSLK
jgi:hypothetical protein